MAAARRTRGLNTAEKIEPFKSRSKTEVFERQSLKIFPGRTKNGERAALVLEYGGGSRPCISFLFLTGER
jgi:hypothetical protein